MKPTYNLFILLFLASLLTLLSPISSQICPRHCGNIPLEYPIGGSPGCGDPHFQKSITCTEQQLLIFATHTGCYPITDIDYDNKIIHIMDPTMSTCYSTRPSKGFGLNWDAPFSFHKSTIFALLGCSTTSSPLYKNSKRANSTYLPQCENESVLLCSELYSCKPISIDIGGQFSSCCVYTPADLGPSFEMDLRKLKCGLYTSIYSFGGEEGNPERWKYGIALEYRFSVSKEYPPNCATCEASNGVCGYAGEDNDFICNCPNGGNASANCYFEGSWNRGSMLAAWSKGTWFFYALALLLFSGCYIVISS